MTMKRSVLGVVAVAVLGVTGCGMFETEQPEPPPLPTKERPIEGAPSIDVRDDAGFFVAPSGNDSADGSRARPFATLARAIYEAKMTQRNVFACQGTFKEDVVLVEGVSMLGGLDCSRPEWPMSDAMTRIESPRSPAVQATFIATPIRFEGFEVIAPEGKRSGESSIAFYTQGTPSITIVRSRLVAKNGANGADGVEPPAIVVSGNVNGEDGATSIDVCSSIYYLCPPPLPGSAVGGNVTCNGKADANIRGGNGGQPGLFRTFRNEQGTFVAVEVYQNNPANDSKPGEGRNAYPGAPGRDGASATGFGTMSVAGYTPKNGTAGTDGTNGSGGSGGKGSWPRPTRSDTIYRGFGGAGGGAGGCGGVAGTPGEGGGASIGLFATRSSAQLVAVEILTGNGGAGGRGTFGAAATRGGAPGKADTLNVGASGGNGGRAGTSGSGAGGPSIGIAYSGTTPTLVETKFSIGQGGAGVPTLTRPDGVGGTSTILASGDGPRAETIPF
jgi:hypothetical protein